MNCEVRNMVDWRRRLMECFRMRITVEWMVVVVWVWRIRVRIFMMERSVLNVVTLCILCVHYYFALCFLHSVQFQLYSLKLFISYSTPPPHIAIYIQIIKPTGRRSQTLLQIRHSRSPRSRLHLHLPPLHRTIHQRIPRLQNH